MRNLFNLFFVVIFVMWGINNLRGGIIIIRAKGRMPVGFLNPRVKSRYIGESDGKYHVHQVLVGIAFR